MKIQISLRSILAGTLVVAVGCVIFRGLQPRDVLSEAKEVSANATELPLADLSGTYVCGARGSVYQLNLLLDGTYDLQDSGCLGTNGHAVGTWQRERNVLLLSPRLGSGSVFELKSLLATEEKDSVVLTPIDYHLELLLENGYSPLWSLTKEDELALLRLSE